MKISHSGVKYLTPPRLVKSGLSILEILPDIANQGLVMGQIVNFICGCVWLYVGGTNLARAWQMPSHSS
jgi:hypothetical protein